MATDGNPRFVRWQGRLIAQLGFVNNTVLVLTTASLGFAVSRESCGWQRCMRWLGILCLAASVCLALWCALNRLCDFRQTVRLARGQLSVADETKVRRKNRDRGELTWTLLRLQLVTFAVGAILAAVALAELD